MYRAFLSWRFCRARRTNLIAVVGLFLGVAVPVVILSVMSGFLEETRGAARGDAADVIVEPLFARPADGPPVERDPAPLLAALRADPRVSAAAVRLTWYGMVGVTDDPQWSERMLTSTQFGHNTVVELVGIDHLLGWKCAAASLSAWLRTRGVPASIEIEDELDATELHAALTGAPELGARVAEPLLPFAPPPGYAPRGLPLASVVVGEQLFWYLNLRRGSVIHVGTAVPRPGTGELVPATREFVVAGSFRPRQSDVSGRRIYLDRRELADFLGDGRSFGQVLVTLADYERDAAGLCADLRALGEREHLLSGESASEVRTWEDDRRELLGAIRTERAMMGVMLSLVLVVAGFTVFAILSMLVTEKRRDIGVLAALGATPRGILQTFLLIGLWDALLGATTGAVAGVWASYRVSELERWLATTLGIEIFNRGVFDFDHIPSRVIPEAVAAMVLFAFVCAVAFAAVPAWRAGKLDPLEALRYE